MVNSSNPPKVYQSADSPAMSRRIPLGKGGSRSKMNQSSSSRAKRMIAMIMTMSNPFMVSSFLWMFYGHLLHYLTGRMICLLNQMSQSRQVLDDSWGYWALLWARSCSNSSKLTFLRPRAILVAICFPLLLKRNRSTLAPAIFSSGNSQENFTG